MLSAFNLPDGSDVVSVSAKYERFLDGLRAEDLIVAYSKIGNRLADTPMDTDAANPRHYFSIMTFRDRMQLDKAYGRLESEMAVHRGFQTLVTDGLFTCWEIDDDS